MFDVVLYASNSGKSLEVAKSFGLPSLNVEEHPCIEKYSNFIIICPTYGDEELPISMEEFILNLKTRNKKYAVCELGNYFGQTWDFGAAKIIITELNKLGWELLERVSLDSTPNVDWEGLQSWKNKLLTK